MQSKTSYIIVQEPEKKLDWVVKYNKDDGKGWIEVSRWDSKDRAIGFAQAIKKRFTPSIKAIFQKGKGYALSVECDGHTKIIKESESLNELANEADNLISKERQMLATVCDGVSIKHTPEHLYPWSVRQVQNEKLIAEKFYCTKEEAQAYVDGFKS